jgi:hypothetical protein
VKESTVFTRKYQCTELTNLSMLSVFEVEVRGGDVIPEWINRRDGTWTCIVSVHFLESTLSFLAITDNFSTLCLIYHC